MLIIKVLDALFAISITKNKEWKTASCKKHEWCENWGDAHLYIYTSMCEWMREFYRELLHEILQSFSIVLYFLILVLSLFFARTAHTTKYSAHDSKLNDMVHMQHTRWTISFICLQNNFRVCGKCASHDECYVIISVCTCVHNLYHFWTGNEWVHECDMRMVLRVCVRACIYICIFMLPFLLSFRVYDALPWRVYSQPNRPEISAHLSKSSENVCSHNK